MINKIFDEHHEMVVAEPHFGAEYKGAIKTHRKADCEGPCALHSPSNHPLNDRPMIFRADKSGLLERTCEHGVGHPDPDSLNFLKKQEIGASHLGVHGCDGCCSTA